MWLMGVRRSWRILERSNLGCASVRSGADFAFGRRVEAFADLDFERLMIYRRCPRARRSSRAVALIQLASCRNHRSRTRAHVSHPRPLRARSVQLLESFASHRWLSVSAWLPNL